MHNIISLVIPSLNALFESIKTDSSSEHMSFHNNMFFHELLFIIPKNTTETSYLTLNNSCENKLRHKSFFSLLLRIL